MAPTQLLKLVAVAVTGSHLIPVIYVGTEREDTDEVTARHACAGFADLPHRRPTVVTRSSDLLQLR